MIIYLHKDSKRGYKKLTKAQISKFKERRNLFLQDQFNPILNNHALSGKYRGYRSINVTGDLRVVYKREGEDVIFVKIDSHSNLCG